MALFIVISSSIFLSVLALSFVSIFLYYNLVRNRLISLNESRNLDGRSLVIGKNNHSNQYQYSNRLLLIGLIFSLILSFLIYNWSHEPHLRENIIENLDLGDQIELVLPRTTAGSGQTASQPTNAEVLPVKPPSPENVPLPTVKEIPIVKEEVKKEITKPVENTQPNNTQPANNSEVANNSGTNNSGSSSNPGDGIKGSQNGNEPILMFSEQMPRFPGCEELIGDKKLKDDCAKNKLKDYIYRNLIYPKEALANKIEGIALIRFVVDKTGKITRVSIAQNPGGGTGEAAKSLVESMNNLPKSWTPGIQNGNPVLVYVTLPISFKLNKKTSVMKN
jgi:periplasmic protein TonB